MTFVDSLPATRARDGHPPAVAAAGAAPARVWIVQPRIEHYRLPVFDRLAALGEGRYTLEVLGPTVDGEARGGGHRPYFRETPYHPRFILGARFHVWPEIRREIRRDTPDVVVVNTHLRHLDCWRLPQLCRRIGASAVGWGKVHSFSGLPGPLLRLGKREMFRRFDYFIAYGECSRREMRALGIADDKICVAQNTIDTSRIFEDGERYRARGQALRAGYGLGDAPILLSVARFDPEKRLHDLLDAWPRLRARHPGLRLVLVGDGRLFDEIRARAAELDPERIVLTGRVPEGDDYAWLATADVAVQCGAVGLAINQSMAFGTPTVIADEYGADTEILEHGRTGWRYARGDLDALVETVRAVFEDTAGTGRIVASARELMREQVTIDRMARSMDACVSRALAVSRERRGSS
jgi:glycosyltransferase involved in cell wall biosynthesis